MAQVGGPKKDDQGDDNPGYKIYDEHKNPDTRPHFTDVLSMANTNTPDSASSQFFVTFTRTTHLDGKHTVFGRVIAGHDVIDRIVRTEIEINGRPSPVPNANQDYIESATVIRKRDHKYRPRKVGEPEEVDEPELPPVTQEAKSFDEDEEKMEEKQDDVKEDNSDKDESESSEKADEDAKPEMSKDDDKPADEAKDDREVDTDADKADEADKTEEPSDS